MTKQEYVARLNVIDDDKHLGITNRLIVMNNLKREYIASLEAEIAQVKKDKLEFNAQCFHKDETISVLKNRITELEFDNRSLVEQMNQMAMRIEHKSGTAQRSQR